jgi:uncharacterized membrane protein
MESSPTETTVVVDPRQVAYTQVMYALHTFAIVIGIFSSASIAGRFVFGLPSIIAVVMNYARRGAVRDTWLASHFRWQLRTFWIAAAILFCLFPLVFTIVLIPVVLAIYGITGIWVVYRIVRGWLALRDGRSVPGAGF